MQSLNTRCFVFSFILTTSIRSAILSDQILRAGYDQPATHTIKNFPRVATVNLIATFDIIIAMIKPIVCAALLLLAVLAHPAVSIIEDGSIYEDYVDIEEVQPVEVCQGSSKTFSVTATNHGNLCYGGVILKYPCDLPEGITISPVEPQTIDRRDRYVRGNDLCQ
jgi:hypothetical protein